MVNRDLIRIKVVQLTYAYYQNGERNIDKAEKELLFSLSKAYGLYNYLLSLIVSITQEERRRVQKFLLLGLPTINLQYNWKKTNS